MCILSLDRLDKVDDFNRVTAHILEVVLVAARRHRTALGQQMHASARHHQPETDLALSRVQALVGVVCVLRHDDVIVP